ncbi:HypC/HybG/HupF family hydrogenase formation chaperone [Ideonella dechloratans]|uniref:HypC/HybG/HupF family hydrogenase formation chaperone n=1 Tax=Ideonella dechloratans TaxID=36863 RepID=A0A643F7Z6_IDEDE|nr:HypC/HybG/HupF family hydrogenase formation chaperone [Ideonella dechloratans]KAB0576383.1 HypC/HybG/HupF family hydrogenase formation chaperone [Ideonella dechloratans]UFU10908.1 HypC/HybG/HupF family hydrogenase formation chaperone [Ideonella dechloratans]
MCLALPSRVVERLPDDQALVDLGGVRKTVSIALTPEAQVGDYVIVHVGHAIGLLDPEEAERTLALFAELEASQAEASQPTGAAT